jgi:formylglycine-generating enzyme required for sulfatase activity
MNPSDDLDLGQTLRGLRAGMKVFGRYELKGELGRGGMGVVWLAQDVRLDLEVALKFLPEHLAHDETAVDDLRRETQRCMKLSHTHIVRVHDLVEEGGAAAIVMEYVKGKTLAKLRLEKAGRVFEVGEVREWVRQVVEALGYAHEEGRMVHRDLKPPNVMVTEKGQVKVMDFGIASSLGDSMSRVSKAAAAGQGTSGGTLPYMSPQQLLGYPASVGDDVYGLGAMIYELLTGKPPFYSGSIERQIESVVPVRMGQRRAELGVKECDPIPEEWEATIAACLEKEMEKRPKSVREVWEGLSGGKKAMTRGASNEGGGESVEKRKRAKKAVLTATGVLVLAGLGWWGGMGTEEAVKGQAAEGVAAPKVDEVTLGGTQAVGSAPPNVQVEAERKETEWDQGAVGQVTQVKLSGEVEMKFAYCPAGSFMMGSPVSEKDREEDEGPVQVKISQGFWLGQTEVTQAQWAAVMGNNPSSFKGDDLPVEQVSWDEAQAFIGKLNQSGALPEGWRYALPTEAQWEYACRAGTESVFHFGEELNGTQANCDGNNAYTCAVGSYKPNAWGLYDVHGNVWEWCEDWYGGKLRGGADPVGATTGPDRVYRGGSWNDLARLCRAANRSGITPDYRYDILGFRLAVVPAGALFFVEKDENPPSTHSTNDRDTVSPAAIGTLPVPELFQTVGRKHTEWDQGAVGQVTQVKLPGEVEMKFAYCPAGSFRMGSPASEAERGDDEDPVQVRISEGFWMGQYEVTQAQWAAVMGSNPSKFKGDDLPVEQVSWEEAQAFIGKLNQSAPLPGGWKYALPSEAQWEYACRAGTSTAFGFGESLSSGEANFNGAWPYGSGAKGPYLAKTSVAGNYKPNGWGLYDMHGNVSEWCADWHGEKLVGGTDPVGVLTGPDRVIRGGSWDLDGFDCRSASRGGYDPGYRLNRYLGFRVAAVSAGVPSPSASGTLPVPEPKVLKLSETLEREGSELDQGAVRKAVEVKLPGGVPLKLCYCPPGNFTMGSPASEIGRSEDEDSVQVKISQGFWMGQTEVTQGQWESVMGSNPSEFKGDDLPVEQVSWEDAQAFIGKLNQSAPLSGGWKYALPSEAQWEYACRAGTSTAFGFGESLSSREANFDGNYPFGSGSKGPSLQTTSEVRSYQENGWGLYDMHGNVNEWCADWYGNKLPGGTDPTGPSTQSIRVIRGGSWNFGGSNCRRADRNGYDPASHGNALGFRVAVVPARPSVLVKQDENAVPILRDNDSDKKLFVPSLPRTAYTRYPWRTKIVATVFWVGDPQTSPWDPAWLTNFGGIDDPDPAQRTADFTAKGFTPGLNPFYVALPYNDCLSSEKHKPEAAKIIPWFKSNFVKAGRSVVRGTWLAIRYENQVCYAQWDNCGPVGADDADYVFGMARPQAEKTSGSGIYVSPAVRDFLNMPSWAKVDWRFVDVGEIPAGPWAKLGMNNHFVRIKELRDRQQQQLAAGRLEELRRQREQALKGGVK